jgi:hypothetical protein
MMLKSICAIIVVFMVTLTTQQSIAKGQGTLSQCQNTKDKIEHYTNLRRSGGSARIMEAWKRKRDHYKDLFSEQNCNKWRGKLK